MCLNQIAITTQRKQHQKIFGKLWVRECNASGSGCGFIDTTRVGPRCWRINDGGRFVVNLKYFNFYLLFYEV